MKFRFVALNSLLLIGILAIVWQARIRMQEARTRREVNLNTAVRPVTPPPLAPASKPEPAPAAKYADVANKDLFAKDRNPVVIIDPPKAEQQKPMPPLPVVYGVLPLPGGTRAIMAEKKGESSVPVRAGDAVGEFTIVSIDPQNVTFRWNDKDISKKIDELIDRSGPADAAGGGRATVQPNATPAGSQISTGQGQQDQQAQRQNTAQMNNAPPSLGVELGVAGQSQRACSPGDASPAGTVLDGYKKVLTPTPFGAMCRWVPAQ